MRTFFTVITLATLAGWLNCHQSKPATNTTPCAILSSNQQKQDLLALLHNMEQESAGFVSMKELKKSKSFQVIYDNPEPYQEEIFRLMTSDQIALTDKTWMIETQSKCDDIYYQFALQIATLVKTNKLDGSGEKVLTHLIMPANSPTNPFLHPENLKFQHLLDDIYQIKDHTPEFLSLVEDIKSGYVLEHWNLYY